MRALLLAGLQVLGVCASTVKSGGSTARTHLRFDFPPGVAALNLGDVHVYDDAAAYGAVATCRLVHFGEVGNPVVSVYVYSTPTYADGFLQQLDAHSQDELRGLLKQYEGAKPIRWHFWMTGPAV